MPGGEIDRLGVDAEDPIEFLLADLLHRHRQVGDAGVVDQDVEGAEGGGRGGGHRGDAGVVANVGDNRQRIELGGGAGDRLGIDVGDHHPGALGAEHPGDARAEAGGAAGDERGLAVEAHGVRS